MKKNIEFIEYSIPTLKAGSYQISVEQKVKIKGTEEAIPIFNKKFAVSADRFKILDEHIHSVSPCSGATGNFSNVLPHIVFSKKTLPWERGISQSIAGNIPWFALLVFNENEFAPNVVQQKLAELATPPKSTFFPKFNLEYGEAMDDLCKIIDIPTELFLKIVPSIEDLAWLSHVRAVDVTKKALKDGQNVNENFSTITASRLPQVGQSNTVHLVSLEGYEDYLPGGASKISDEFVRLVSLRSWSFSTTAEKFSFQDVFKNLNTQPGSLYIVPTSSTDLGAQSTINAMNMGFVPLQHQTRLGDTTVSWYRGPFAPYSVPEFLSQSASNSDSLVNYNPDIGMYNVSYAAAYQLGILLAIQDSSFSNALINWKMSLRNKALGIAIKNFKEKFNISHVDSHLKIISEIYQNEDFGLVSDMPLAISNWLVRLKLLYGVPFYYLIPDQRLLPKESIRFFYVDPNWTDSIIRGAMSLGEGTKLSKTLSSLATNLIQDRVLKKAIEFRANQLEKNGCKLKINTNGNNVFTGFLLRSIAVKTWQGMEVRAFDINNNPLEIVRMEILAADLLLCIISDEITKLILSEPSEAIHFGLEENTAPSPSQPWKKSLRYVSTSGMDSGSTIKGSEIAVPINTNGTIRVAEFAKDIENALKNTFHAMPSSANFTTAEFALEMVQGVEEVTFIVPK